jgi:hypothetical protein
MSDSRTPWLPALAAYLLGLGSGLLVPTFPAFDLGQKAAVVGLLGAASVTLFLLARSARRGEAIASPAPAAAPPGLADPVRVLPRASTEPAQAPTPLPSAVGQPTQQPPVSSPSPPSAHPLSAPEPSVRALAAEDAIQLWRSYLETGDGHFNVAGFNLQLAANGWSETARTGSTLGQPDWVLAIEAPPGSGAFLLLPDFRRNVHEVAALFDHPGAASRVARIRRLGWPARGRWERGGFQLVEKGRVE